MKEKQKYFTLIRNYKRSCSNLVSKATCYNTWDDNFCRNELKKLYYHFVEQFKGVDFTQFSFDELIHQFDFVIWDENIVLMPIWALDCIEHGTLICSISGEYFNFDESKGLDKDERFGASAFGFNISQIRENKLNSILNENN